MHHDDAFAAWLLLKIHIVMVRHCSCEPQGRSSLLSNNDDARSLGENGHQSSVVSASTEVDGTPDTARRRGLHEWTRYLSQVDVVFLSGFSPTLVHDVGQMVPRRRGACVRPA